VSNIAALLRRCEAQVLFYPPTDAAMSSGSYETFAPNEPDRPGAVSGVWVGGFRLATFHDRAMLTSDLPGDVILQALVHPSRLPLPIQAIRRVRETHYSYRWTAIQYT
jgi:acetyl esterase/lipase